MGERGMGGSGPQGGGNVSSFCHHILNPLEPGGLTQDSLIMPPFKDRHRTDKTYCLWLPTPEEAVAWQAQEATVIILVVLLLWALESLGLGCSWYL